MTWWDDPTLATQNKTPNVGELGEQLVAGWLKTQNWVILHHRWRCRWGEIDLIAQQQERGQVGEGEQGRRRKGENFLPNVEANRQLHSSLVAFVEVKTRSRGNWDVDGLLAITPTKQAKLQRAAQLFLAEHPYLASLPCRFDVALVNCQRLSQRSRCGNSSLSPSAETISQATQLPSIELGQPIVVAGYRLILQDYIQSAFD